MSKGIGDFMKLIISLKHMALLGILIPSISFAEITAKDGIDRLKQNTENANANLENYKKNLKVVDGNISEITKAKNQVENERNEVNNLAKQNQTSLNNLEKQEQELSKLINKEEKEAQNEAQKVKELENLILQLKANQEKRVINVTKYKQQLDQANKEKIEWKTRQEQYAKQQKEINDRVAAIKKTEKDWTNKKRGYEGEISRWQKESEKHQKLFQQYSAMTH